MACGRIVIQFNSIIWEPTFQMQFTFEQVTLALMIVAWILQFIALGKNARGFRRISRHRMMNKFANSKIYLHSWSKNHNSAFFCGLFTRARLALPATTLCFLAFIAILIALIVYGVRYQRKIGKRMLIFRKITVLFSLHDVCDVRTACGRPPWIQLLASLGRMRLHSIGNFGGRLVTEFSDWAHFE